MSADRLGLHYLNLRVAQDLVERFKPRKFRNATEAFEWTFNIKYLSRDSIDTLSQMIFLHVHDLLDFDRELDLAREQLNTPKFSLCEDCTSPVACFGRHHCGVGWHKTNTVPS